MAMWLYRLLLRQPIFRTCIWLATGSGDGRVCKGHSSHNADVNRGERDVEPRTRFALRYGRVMSQNGAFSLSTSPPCALQYQSYQPYVNARPKFLGYLGLLLISLWSLWPLFINWSTSRSSWKKLHTRRILFFVFWSDEQSWRGFGGLLLTFLIRHSDFHITELEALNRIVHLFIRGERDHKTLRRISYPDICRQFLTIFFFDSGERRQEIQPEKDWK